MFRRLAAFAMAGIMAVSMTSCSLTYREMVEEERNVPVPP